VLEVSDLGKTRAFYDHLFEHAGGAWRQDRAVLTFQSAGQTVQFVQKEKPRAFPDSGFHWAYRIPAAKIGDVIGRLGQAGSVVRRWREDHPLEREISLYTQDPDGNIAQLVPSDDRTLLIDHVGIEIHMFDYCEYLYVAALGGAVDYYHGWRTSDLQEAKNWTGGEDDPCAPWTRRDNPTYRDYLVPDPATGELRPSRFSSEFGGVEQPRRIRVPRPNGQVFVSYGPTRVGLFSATKVRQEPPEEQVKGTPRIVLSTRRSAADVAKWLERFPIPQLREHNDFFLRDADGNFCQLTCAG
jgi:predicted enzyme related to lactoylglutathione lyase